MNRPQSEARKACASGTRRRRTRQGAAAMRPHGLTADHNIRVALAAASGAGTPTPSPQPRNGSQPPGSGTRDMRAANCHHLSSLAASTSSSSARCTSRGLQRSRTSGDFLERENACEVPLERVRKAVGSHCSVRANDVGLASVLDDRELLPGVPCNRPPSATTRQHGRRWKAPPGIIPCRRPGRRNRQVGTIAADERNTQTDRRPSKMRCAGSRAARIDRTDGRVDRDECVRLESEQDLWCPLYGHRVPRRRVTEHARIDANRPIRGTLLPIVPNRRP